MHSDDDRDQQAARVAVLRQEIEFYENLLAERRELLLEAEYELGVIDGHRGETR